ncbi:hypothetical protein [Hydrogenophaga sp.]|uniref:hypothetical protein n=1 Tax=Hydrogenophaga sp. TaxID=1904254 RepID=UPI00271D2C8D|nr:hypothetical protein [Hydrogenophaga sp.]MDO9438630.1 hypothetical protein [Hydrogenophaga sp.]
MLDAIFYLGIAMLGLSSALMWWRIFLPAAASLLISWLVANVTPFDSGWFSWALLALGLVVGAAWHRNFKRAADPI